MRVVLVDRRVGSERGADEEAVGGPGEHRAVDRRVVGERRCLGPQERLGRADRCVHRPEVDVVDDAQVGAGVDEPARLRRRRVLRRGHAGHRDVVAHDVGLVGVEQHDEARAQAVALPDGHGVAGERAPVVHRVDGQLGGRVDAARTGEDRLDRTDVLARMAQRRGDDRLRQELTAEDDVAVFGVTGVGDSVAVVADAVRVGARAAPLRGRASRGSIRGVGCRGQWA